VTAVLRAIASFVFASSAHADRAYELVTPADKVTS
jgi:hypothetical protein